MITKELLLEGLEWRQRMYELSHTSNFSYDLIYITFQTVMDYYGSENKNTDYWRDLLFDRCCIYESEKLARTDWRKYPDLMGGMTKSKKEDLDISVLDAETAATLKAMAKGGKVKAIHGVAMRMVLAAMHCFIECNDKHPFDYAVDAKEDFEIFFKIETSCREGAEN